MRYFTASDMTIHPSWLLAWLSVGALLGIVVSPWLQLFDQTQALCILLALSFIIFRSQKRSMLILALVAGCIGGAARGAHLQQDLTVYTKIINTTQTITGTIREDTSTTAEGGQRVRLKNIVVNDKPIAGDIWLSISSREQLKRTDRITVRGLISPGFGTMSATMYRAEILSIQREKFADVPRDVRDWFAVKVRSAVQEPQSSLGIGFLTGQRSTLPEELEEELVLLGLTHVVVASGYNLTILVRFSRRAFAKRSKYLAALAASLMIISFVLITGFSPSMSRAALVAGLSLLAWYFGRSSQPLVLLSVSAAITALINPAFVWGDIGWYLSFTSFAGIMLLAPLITHYFWGEMKPNGISRIIVETMSAQLATLPIIALIFAQYSPLALPANLLILPLIPLAMLLTFAAGVGSALVPDFATIFGWPAEIVLSYMTIITSKLAETPWARAEVSFTWPAFVVSYGVLLGIGLLLWRKTKHRFSKDNIVV